MTTTAARPVAGDPTRPDRAAGLTYRLAAWWPAVYGAAVGALLFVVAHRAMPDDGLISLSFARNLAEHGQWAITTGVESNTATSPLNVWLLAALHLLTGGRAFVAAALLLMASLAGTAMGLRRLGGPAAAVLGPALLASSPVLTSSIGLETYLCAAVLVGLVRYAADGRWVLAGLLCGAAFLARPDLTIAAVAAVLVLAAGRHRRLLWALLLGAAATLPWVVFSWWQFGSAWSNSVAVKWANGSWAGSALTDAGYWWEQFPGPAVTVAVTLAAGAAAVLVALGRRQWPAVALGMAGAAHLAALASADTPPIEYYLAPAVVGLGLALVLVAARSPRWALAAPAAVIVGAVVLSILHGPLWAQGIAPMRQNIATNDQYRAIVQGLPVDGAVMGGEVGAYAFYCQDRVPACTVVDPVLSDPARVDGLVSRWRQFHPAWELNYRHYDVPPAVPVRYRMDLGLATGRAGDWPVTRSPVTPGPTRWGRLSLEPNPFTPK